MKGKAWRVSITASTVLGLKLRKWKEIRVILYDAISRCLLGLNDRFFFLRTRKRLWFSVKGFISKTAPRGIRTRRLSGRFRSGRRKESMPFCPEWGTTESVGNASRKTVASTALLLNRELIPTFGVK